MLAKKSQIEDRGSSIAIRPSPSSIFHPLSIFLAALFLALLHATLANALQVPPLRARINDYAGLLSPDRARLLEDRLAAFERDTGHQVAVLTIPSLEGDALEDFSIRVAESWKIGQKGFDNGAILLVAQKERRLRIEVGYGLEGVLPDAIANRIINEVIVPRFRQNDYSGGIEAGVNAILQVTKGEPLPERARTSAKSNGAQVSSLLTALTLTAILALFIGMTQRRLTGGAFGGAVAGLVTTLGSAAGIGFVLVVALILGAVLGAIGSTMSVTSSGWTGGSRYRRGGWGGGIFPGGGFGGGGFGGGGFGGGGFSGGGGGFGGGGASGSW